ncbi:hypothetical protein A4X13_0g4346 [Tilletia indica]|uniref:Uncharacterized protein n=1 Tax=Tilletia indica TaxID=43049 RepID=A0A177TC73_9BASI|nr:hypothetical protein A4X13_0g4346 [Tilletia indica]
MFPPTAADTTTFRAHSLMPTSSLFLCSAAEVNSPPSSTTPQPRPTLHPCEPSTTAAGLTAYNHNVDINREYYDKIVTSRSYDDRILTISAVCEADISVRHRTLPYRPFFLQPTSTPTGPVHLSNRAPM